MGNINQRVSARIVTIPRYKKLPHFTINIENRDLTNYGLSYYLHKYNLPASEIMLKLNWKNKELISTIDQIHIYHNDEPIIKILITNVDKSTADIVYNVHIIDQLCGLCYS